MDTQAQQDSNKDFGIPETADAPKAKSREEALREKARQMVAEVFDETALLEQFVKEEQAKRAAEVRNRAATLAQQAPQDFDAHGFPKKYFEISIFRGTEQKALGYVPVGVNGYAWKIQRGAKVIVPSVVVDALNDAITEEVVQADGGLITSPVHRFPFQTHREVSEDEYIKYRERMKSAGKDAALTVS